MAAILLYIKYECRRLDSQESSELPPTKNKAPDPMYMCSLGDIDLEGYKLAQPSVWTTSTYVHCKKKINRKRKHYIPRYIITKFNEKKYKRRGF